MAEAVTQGVPGGRPLPHGAGGGVTAPGWREASAPFGEEGSLRSVADITSPETRIQVRDAKKAMKAAAKAGSA